MLEARNRVGGRILCPEHHGFFPDLGPSWYWPDIHPRMAHLVQHLGLEGYPQFEDGFGRMQGPDGRVQTVRGYVSQPRSWRLRGGMQALVAGLCREIPETIVRCDHPVCRIEKTPAGLRVDVGELEQVPAAQFRAETVILALPPRLAAATIWFEPELPDPLAQAMLKTGTWMAGQAKFFALYETPFWRRKGFSGEAFSQRGPLGEIHDGSADAGAPYGLTGFVGLPAVRRKPKQGIMDAIVSQLGALFDAPGIRPTAFYYRDWAQERFTATPYDLPPMTRHPVYAPPAGRTAFWDGTVRFAGTETADPHGGYLEGALIAAERAVADL